MESVLEQALEACQEEMEGQSGSKFVSLVNWKSVAADREEGFESAKSEGEGDPYASMYQQMYGAQLDIPEDRSSAKESVHSAHQS